MLIISSTSSNARDVESMATNLAIGDVSKIKMKKIKMKRKLSIKSESSKEFATTVNKRGILVRTVGCIRTAIKKIEKAERAIDGDGDELVLCSLMRDSEK